MMQIVQKDMFFFNEGAFRWSSTSHRFRATGLQTIHTYHKYDNIHAYT